MPTNAQRLRNMLEATAGGTVDSRKMVVDHAMVSVKTTVEQIRRGEMLVISRERIESVLAELEGREPPPSHDRITTPSYTVAPHASGAKASDPE